MGTVAEELVDRTEGSVLDWRIEASEAMRSCGALGVLALGGVVLVSARRMAAVA